jgi:hypothetical protein
MPENPNAFLETTDVYDVDIIKGLDINSEEFKEFLVRLRQNINNIALSVNGRDGGYSMLGEFNTGSQLFPDPADPNSINRSEIRDTINFGALPNNATTSVNHHMNAGNGTTASYIMTEMSVTATDPIGLTYIQVPYADTAGNIITYFVNSTQVVITSNFNASNYTNCIVKLKYIVNS